MSSSASTSADSMPTAASSPAAQRRSSATVSTLMNPQLPVSVSESRLVSTSSTGLDKLDPLFAGSRQARLVSTSSTRFSRSGAVAQVGQARLLVELDARLDDRFERPIHDGVEVVRLVARAVVGDPVLREVVGADALRPVHGADLALARGTVELGLVLRLLGEDARTQHA